MQADDQLEALLDRWHEATSAGEGKALTPAELCRDTPHLLPELQRCLTLLSRFEALRSDTVGETLMHQPAATTPLPGAPATYGAARRTPTSALPAVGEEFDGYLIVAEMGRGGMGCVFRASNLLLKRDEALKVMLPEVAAKPQARERFLREARAMAAVRHDHIVEVYHVRQVGDIPYLAMPLLAGETLADRLMREKTLSVAEVIRIGLQMAEGLAAAHARGLIHRDIKPGNVWLENGTNRVKLLDFGLVRAAGTASDLTTEGSLLGTPPYMSPEQVNGEIVDARSDLFSIGSVLYECATGKRAFSGDKLTAILLAVAQSEPPAAREVNASVPAALSEVIGALLHKNPEQRPASALELAQRLQTLKIDGTAADKTISRSERQPILPRRLWPWLAAAGCMLVLGLCGSIAISKGWFVRSPSEVKVERTEPAPEPVVLAQAAPVIVTPPAAVIVTPPARVEALRVLKIDVHLSEPIGEENAKDRGVIGQQSFAAGFGDQAAIVAKLSRPAYAYLIAFNPDGTSECCFPASADEAPPLTDQPSYPLIENRTKRFGFTDGVGLMVFAVVASDQPLPPYREWAAQNRPEWKHAEGTLGEVWCDSGDLLLDILTSTGPKAVDRGTGQEAKGRSGAVVRLSDSLKQGKKTIAVGSIGFVVQKR